MTDDEYNKIYNKICDDLAVLSEARRIDLARRRDICNGTIQEMLPLAKRQSAAIKQFQADDKWHTAYIWLLYAAVIISYVAWTISWYSGLWIGLAGFVFGLVKCHDCDTNRKRLSNCEEEVDRLEGRWRTSGARHESFVGFHVSLRDGDSVRIGRQEGLTNKQLYVLLESELIERVKFLH